MWVRVCVVSVALAVVVVVVIVVILVAVSSEGKGEGILWEKDKSRKKEIKWKTIFNKQENGYLFVQENDKLNFCKKDCLLLGR